MKNISVKRNFIYQMVYELLILILPFVTSPYIARIIGSEGIGIYSYSYSIAYYFVLFSQLGIKNYGNRVIAQVRNNKLLLNQIFSEVFGLHLIVSIVCTFIYIIYIFLIAKERLYALIMLPYVISGIIDISWFYFGIERFKVTVTTNTIIRIINVLCVFVFVKETSDLWKYCLVMSLGMLLSQIVLWFPLRKYVSFVVPNTKRMVVHVKPLLVLFIPAIAVSLYKYMDKIMIGSMSSAKQLGFYENAEKVINLPMTIVAAFGTVMLPKMSSLAHNKDQRNSMRYMKLSIEFVMCLAFGLTFGLAGVASVFAPLFWGDNFSDCSILIMGLSTTIPFVAFANVIRTQYLIPNEKDKEYLVSVIIGAMINLFVNWLLIPLLGSIGAMIGTIAAEIIVCSIQCITVRKEIPVLKYIKQSIPFALIGLATFIVVTIIGKALQNHVYTLICQVIIGAIVYLSLSMVYFMAIQNEIVINIITKYKHKIFRL